MLKPNKNERYLKRQKVRQIERDKNLKDRDKDPKKIAKKINIKNQKFKGYKERA